MRLKCQTAIVTGAGRGLGEQVARAFCREGARVVLASEVTSEVQAVAAELTSQGFSAMAVHADVRDEKSVRSLFQAGREHFGEIDVLVNNAGAMLVEAVVDTDSGIWDNVIAVNLRGTFLCSREALKGMIPRREGLILNVTSGFGYKGGALVSAYSASKFGVEGFSQSLASEVREYGIRVNTIQPGGAARTVMARAAVPKMSGYIEVLPEDNWLPADILCKPAIFLASSEGAGITGKSILAREWRERNPPL